MQKFCSRRRRTGSHLDRVPAYASVPDTSREGRRHDHSDQTFTTSGHQRSCKTTHRRSSEAMARRQPRKSHFLESYFNVTSFNGKGTPPSPLPLRH